MKTNKSTIAFLFVLLTAQATFAFYSPATGRWLSRDPIGEPGFQVLQAVTRTTMPQVNFPAAQTPIRWITRDPISEPQEEVNLYIFVENNPINYCDPLGLSCNHPCPPDKPSGGNDFWNKQINNAVRFGSFSVSDLVDNGVPQDYINKMAQYYQEVGECGQSQGKDPRVKPLNDCRTAFLRGQRTTPCGNINNY